jgi:ferredoxin
MPPSSREPARGGACSSPMADSKGRACGKPKGPSFPADVAAEPPSKEPAVRVAVDRLACEANGICAGLVPEVFELDDEDILHVLDGPVPPQLADAVRHAVRSCPKTALGLVEGESGE